MKIRVACLFDYFNYFTFCSKEVEVHFPLLNAFHVSKTDSTGSFFK